MTGEPSLVDAGDVTRSAVLSPCGGYRYALRRSWGPGPTVLFVMLNPSTADATDDDPTVRRCMGFARALGMDGASVVNLFAFRATNPDLLWTHPRGRVVGPDDPICETDRHICQEAQSASMVVCAWGALSCPAGHRAFVHGRARWVSRMLVGQGVALHALWTTAEGWPAHPLYLSGELRPVPWVCP